MLQWILPAFALAYLVGAYFYLRGPVALLLRIRRTSTSLIAALPMSGEAEVVGRAQPEGEPLLSPVGRTPCVLWQVEVQEYRSTGKSGSWRTLIKHASSIPFTLDDGTGSLRVEPAGAQLTLDDDLKEARGIFHDLSPQAQESLEAMGISLTGFLGFRRQLRVYERVITPGEQIFVLGLVAQTAALPRMYPGQGLPVIIADRSERALLNGLMLKLGLTLLISAAAVGFILFIMMKLPPA